MYSLRFLGGVSFEGPSGAVSGRPAQKRELALLAILAVAPQGATRDKLVGCLWPDTEEDTARHLLSNALYVLRREMGEESVRAAGDTVRLDPGIVSSDVGAFQEALAAGDLEKAMALYAGPFLGGFYADAGSAFQDWVDTERQRLALLYAEVLESLADRAEAANDHTRAAVWWQRLVVNDPYNSRAVFRLMQALVAAGDRANALRAASRHERLLKDELGLSPAPDLLVLARKLQEKQTTAAEERPTAAALCQPKELIRRRQFVTGRRAVLGIATALALGGAVATGVVLLRAPARPTGGAGIPVLQNRIAVMPFDYAGREESAYLGAGVAQVLAINIDGAGELTTVDPFALLKHVERQYDALDPDQAAEIARFFGAGGFILGSILEAGGNFQASAVLYDLYGSRKAAAESFVDAEAQVVDKLTYDLARQLLAESLDDAPERLTQAGATTTQSLKAMKAYLQGERLARAGKFDSASVAYQSAVDLDTTFALAYYRLASNAPGGGSFRNDALIERARRFSGRLSWRDSLLVEAFHAAWVRDAYDQAEETYQRLLTRHPNDLDAWVNYTILLGESPLFYRGRPYADLRDAAERALKLDPNSLWPNTELSLIAAFEGDFAKAVACWERLHEAQPEGMPSALHRTVLASLRSNAGHLERAIVELGAGLPPPIYLAGEWILTVADDAPTARRIFELLTQPRWSRAWRVRGHQDLLRLELARGRWRAAMREAAALVELDSVSGAADFAAAWLTPFMLVATEQLSLIRDSLASWRTEPDSTPRAFFLGLLNARLGEAEQAEAIAEELEGYTYPGVPVTFSSNMALTVRAQAAAKQGRYEESLYLLQQVEPLSRWTASYARPERWLRAEVLYALGRYEDALPWYEAFAMGIWEQAYATQALFRIGEIHEHLGNRQVAARQYRRFLKRWDGCDPELRPWVDQAQKALHRITGND